MSHVASVLAHQEQFSRIVFAKPHAAVIREYAMAVEADALAMAARNPSGAMERQAVADGIRSKLQLRLV